MVKVKIQLTGELEGYLDVKEGTAFPIVFSGSDVRDLTQRTGNTSKTVKLANTPNNHKLLGFYFDVNAESGKFNVNKITPCIVLEDGVPIMDNAVLQLTTVTKSTSNNNHDHISEYEVIVKDQTANFFTKLGNAELTDLRFTELNHEYTAENVVNSFSHTIEDGYKYLTPFTVGSSYNLSEFRPAIYAKRYFDRIFETAGFSYEWEDIDDINTRFSKWIIPYNGETPRLREDEAEQLKVQAEASEEFEFKVMGDGATGNVAPSDLLIDTEITDLSGAYNPTTNEYTSPVYTLGDGLLSFRLNIDWEMYLDNNEAGTVYLKDIASSVFQKVLKLKPYVTIQRNGVYFGSSVNLYNGNVLGEFPILEEYELPVGETVVYSGTQTVELADNLTSVGAVYKVQGGIVSTPEAGLRFKETDSTVAPDASVTLGLRIKSVTLEIVPSVSGLGYGSTIYVNDFIPKKIKQSDFIKSIFTLLNIYADIDQFNASKLILKKRDAFFDSGREYDMTKKIAKDKDQVINFIPSLQSKKIKFTYKQDSDDVNKGYLEATGEVYGELEFTFDNDFVRDTEVKELIFSPTPVGRTEFGAVVPYINGVEPKNNIRLLYDGGELSCQPFKIIDYITPSGVEVSTTVNTYSHLSHFDKPVNPTFDLNFGLCDYYFYPDFGARTNNNQFNLNWRRTMNQMNEGKMLTAYFHLTAGDISKMRLNDRWFIHNSWWNINKIEYNASSDVLTKCELISVDASQKFKRFFPSVPIKPTIGDILLSPIKGVINAVFGSNNIVLTEAPVTVLGKNNLIGKNVKSATVYGDGNKVMSDKSVVIGDGVVADEAGVYTPMIRFSSSQKLDGDVLDGILNKPKIKAGEVLDLDFSGSPLKATVTFAEPFPVDKYSVVVTGGDPRMWTVERIVEGSFVINSNSSTALTTKVQYIAILAGEY